MEGKERKKEKSNEGKKNRGKMDRRKISRSRGQEKKKHQGRSSEGRRDEGKKKMSGKGEVGMEEGREGGRARKRKAGNVTWPNIAVTLVKAISPHRVTTSYKQGRRNLSRSLKIDEDLSE